MTEKLPPLSLRQGMKIWQEERLKVSDQQDGHISSEALSLLLLPGGLERGDEPILQHLASCPLCLKKWAEACRGSIAEDSFSAADDWYSGGLLEAAASVPTGRPFSLPSQCGRFVFRIFPEQDQADRGLAALEVSGDEAKEKVEGKWVTVRDNHGKVLLEGRIVAGRVARTIENLSGYDLQSWSLVVQSIDAIGHEK